jgi:hypothetical protein
MAGSAAPIYAATPKCSANLITTAGDVTGTNVATVMTAGANGARVERVLYAAVGTTVAAVWRLFVHDPVSGDDWLIEEYSVPAVTASGSTTIVQGDSLRVGPGKPLFLPAGWSLTANTSSGSSQVTVTAIYGDF